MWEQPDPVAHAVWMTMFATGAVLGDFRVEAELGRGGMGVVYRATQTSLGRPVALKVIAESLTGQPGFRERFVRESRVAASLDHPNVIPVYAAGEHEGVLYIAMRFVEGTDLRALIARHGRLDPARAVGVVAQVASALDAAHERGLVHRDVKPGNVIVAARGGEHTYLTDFGLTKRTASESALTAAGDWVGTLDYVAPEQVRGDPLDGRGDIYALGCVLYEMLTGQIPFPRENDLAKLWAHVSDPAPSVLESAPEAPAALAGVVERAMAKDPADRFPMAGELGRAALAAVPAGGDTGARSRAAAAGAAPPPLTLGDAALPSTRRLRLPPGLPAAPRRRTALLVGLAVGLLAAVGAVLVLRVSGDESDHTSGSEAVRASAAGRVTGEPIRVGDSPGGLAASAGMIWVANTGDETVSRIDARSGEVVGRPIPVGEDPGAVTVGSRAVWVANFGDGTVTRIDPRSGRRVGRPIAVGRGPTDLAVGRGVVWVATELDRVVRIDPRTHRAAGTPIRVKSGGPLALAGDLLWVADEVDGTVRSIDTRSGTIVDAPIPIGDSPTDLAAGRNELWVSVAGEGAIKRIDPGTGSPRVRTIRLGGRPERLALGGGALWVTNGEHESVSRLDLASGDAVGDPLRVGEDPAGIALAFGRVWVSSAVTDRVNRVDPR